MNHNYSSLAVANYFLDLAEKDGVEITPLKVQKLVYIAHGCHLALTATKDNPHGEPLVSDEYAEAWKYGPVFPSLYYEFRNFGGNAITRRAIDIDIIQVDGNSIPRIETPNIDSDDIRTRRLLDDVWRVYGKYSGTRLSTVTHAKHSPWDQTYKEGVVRNTHIPNTLICDYYKDKLRVEI